jgi:hypothetical protein
MNTSIREKILSWRALSSSIEGKITGSGGGILDFVETTVVGGAGGFLKVKDEEIEKDSVSLDSMVNDDEKLGEDLLAYCWISQLQSEELQKVRRRNNFLRPGKTSDICSPYIAIPERY